MTDNRNKETAAAVSAQDIDEAVLEEVLHQHFQPLSQMLVDGNFKTGVVECLGEELAQYCQGSPEVLGYAQLFLQTFLSQGKNLQIEYIVRVLSEFATGFVQQSRTQIFEQYQLLIDNYHTVQQRLLREKTQLALINDIGQKIAAVLDLDKLFSRMAEFVQMAFGYHHVAIFTIAGDKVVLQAVAGNYASSFKVGYSQSVHTGIVGWVATHGQDYLSNNVSESAEFVSLVSEMAETRSELCVPIKIAQKVVGLLDLQSPVVGAFEADDVKTLHILVDQLAVAIENARLHQELQQELVERQQAEKALRESEQRYRHIVESQTEMICRFTKEGFITFANLAFSRAFDDETHRLIGRPIFQLVYKDDLDSFLQHLQQLSINTATVSCEHRIQALDGTIRWHRCTCQGFFNSQADLVEIQSVGQDITKSKHLEEAMHRAQKLESLGILAGGVAHDFNNLLTAITTESNLALLKLSNSHIAVEPHLANILTIAEQASNLTQQLLTYAGEGQTELKPVDINEIVADILVIASASISKVVTILPHLDQDLPTIDGDWGQLQQVIMNLVINAAESYQGRPGVVEICTLVEENFETGENCVVVQVVDQGCGIDPEAMTRIFDPFYTTKLTGRGLGLAAVQGIVHAHQGEITVYSLPEHGTTFRVQFPVGNLAEKSVEDVCAHQTTKLGILFIEDDVAIRRSMTEILMLKGFDMYTAENGADGLIIFDAYQEHINLVILDMTMPVMSGEETLAKLRQRTPHIPVIVLSGYGKKEVMDSLQEADHLIFLQKPFKLNNLLQAIETLYMISKS